MKISFYKKIDSKIIVYCLLWIWIFSNCFTAIDSNWLPALKGTYSGLHIHNIVAIFLVIYTITRGKLKFPKRYIYIFMLFFEMTIVWLFNSFKWGISSGYISVVYGIFMMICIASMREYINMKMVSEIMESISIIMTCCILINILLNIGDVFSSIRAGWGHPKVEVFFGGGHNVEAVWMTMFGVFVRKKWKYRYWLFTCFLSAIYLSRTGILVNILLLFVYLFQDGRRKILQYSLWISLLILVAGMVLYVTGLYEYIWNRFARTGVEIGSMSRLKIWTAMLNGMIDKPLGIGFGNTMKFLRETYCLKQNENNAHNIYLQYLLENNIIGFLLFMYGWVKLAMQQIKSRFLNPCGTFLILYAFQGLFQMQVKEPFLFLMLAFYFLITYDCENC